MKDRILNFPLLIVYSVFSIFLASCASMPTKTASTPAKTYKAPFNNVYEASIRAFQNLGLEIFKKDKEKGYVEGGRKPGFGRGAENVGVFIETTSPSKTLVKVDNRKAMWGYLFAVDWTEKIFDQISNELKP